MKNAEARWLELIAKYEKENLPQPFLQIAKEIFFDGYVKGAIDEYTRINTKTYSPGEIEGG